MTLSPILPMHDADTIALDFGVFIAERARTYRTSQTAIIAALRPIIADGTVISRIISVRQPDGTTQSVQTIPPSQSERAHSRALVADALAAQAAGDMTDGEADSSSLPTAPSVDPIPDAPKPFPASSGLDVQPTEEKTSDQGALSSEPGGVQDQRESTPPSPSTASTPAASRSLADAAKQDYDRIRRWHRKHPDWPARLIAAKLGISYQRVTMLSIPRGLVLPTQAEYDESKTRDRTKGIEAALREETKARRIRLGFQS